MKRENNNNQYNNTNSSPLKVQKASHAIKRSYSTSTSTSSRFVPSLVVAGSRPNQHHQRGPVIIYTHSPKVINTNPRDFMSLVQKLTGMSRSKDDNVGSTNKKIMTIKMSGNDNDSSTNVDDNESSSAITDENCSSGTMDNALLFDPAPALVPGPLVQGFSLFGNDNESDLGRSCNSGDLPVYDYMNNGFPYYNPIS
ncbi:hypothetical protein vseg_020910 [Gypsophila vaccaria]